MTPAAPIESICILGVATASIATTISHAGVFESLRERIEDRSEWLGRLIRCPYCTGHWVAFALTAVFHQEVRLFPSAGLWQYIPAAFVTITVASFISAALSGLWFPSAAEEEDTTGVGEMLKVVEQSAKALNAAKARIQTLEAEKVQYIDAIEDYREMISK